MNKTDVIWYRSAGGIFPFLAFFLEEVPLSPSFESFAVAKPIEIYPNN
jgi:hypothetical protein